MIEDIVSTQLTQIDPIAFSFAEGGAMGSPGSIEVISRSITLHNFSMFEHSYEELIEIVPELSYMNTKWTHLKDIDVTKPLTEEWYYVDMGAGNHLMINSIICLEFRKRTEEFTRPCQIYQHWKYIVFDILEHQMRHALDVASHGL